MRSWILMLALAALLVNVAFTLPVDLEETEDVKVSDDELLRQLEGQSKEDDSDSSAQTHSTHGRVERSASDSSSAEKDKKKSKDEDSNNTSSASAEDKTDKPVHSARRKRATADEELDLDDPVNTFAGGLKDDANLDVTDEHHEENPDDYVQGCEVQEVNSNEVNNETFLE